MSRPLSNGTGVVVLIGAPFQIAWLNRNLDSASRATVISTTVQVNVIGQAAGGPAPGWVDNAVSIQAALLASAVVLAPTIAFCHRLIARRRRPAEALATLPELIRNEKIS